MSLTLCGDTRRLLIVGLQHVFLFTVRQCELLFGLRRHKIPQRGGISHF